jgi:4'-phosphopantetheinyl transferase
VSALSTQATIAAPGARLSSSPLAISRALDRHVEVHLADLRLNAEERAVAIAMLSADERRRAMEIKLEDPRRRFIATRAALRILLGERLELEPSRVRLCSDSFGKPALDRQMASGWSFNVSHSAHLAILAFSQTAGVGVDIERVDPRRPWCALLGRACGAREAREAAGELERLGELAFFERWVAKEAVMKALGHGPTRALAGVRLRRDVGGELFVVESERALSPAASCELTSLDVPSGFVGALALADPVRAILPQRVRVRVRARRAPG